MGRTEGLVVIELPGSATPAHLRQLVGLTSHGIFEGLGRPGYVGGDGDDATQLTWLYFLRSSSKDSTTPEDVTGIVSAGGGYPVVTLHFDAAKTVVRAECALAR
jgi:hypothetical protein